MRSHARHVLTMSVLTLCSVCAPVTHAQTSETDKLLNWLEDSYPKFLSPRRPPTQMVAPYAVRAYGETNTYLGVSSANNHLYFFSAGSGLVDLGPTSAFPLPPVELELCQDISADPKVHQPLITCVGPTNTFSSANTDKRDNVWVVMRFAPKEGYHWRLLMTANTPDGRMEQDRTVIPTATHFNMSSSFAVAFPGTYCLTVFDSFDENKRYSATSCFEVK